MLFRSKEEVEIDEAIKLKSKVVMHAPGKDYHGQVGYVGEIRHGAHKKAAKTYTVDYGSGNSVQLGKENIRLHKEEVEIDEGNPINKQKKNAAASAVGAKNRDSQYLDRMNPAVADKIRGREKMSGVDRKQYKEEVEQVEEGLGASSIKHKQKLSYMSDKEFANHPHYSKMSDADLR